MFHERRAFKIIPEEFSQEIGTLTATMKVRRREVIKRYEALLESMYEG